MQLFRALHRLTLDVASAVQRVLAMLAASKRTGAVEAAAEMLDPQLLDGMQVGGQTGGWAGGRAGRQAGRQAERAGRQAAGQAGGRASREGRQAGGRGEAVIH